VVRLATSSFRTPPSPVFRVRVTDLKLETSGAPNCGNVLVTSLHGGYPIETVAKLPFWETQKFANGNVSNETLH